MVVTSGTATLETAFIGTPFVLAYKTSSISYHIASKLVRLKWIGLPNIIMEKSLIPELIQDEATSANIYRAIQNFLSDPHLYDNTIEELKQLRELLSERKTSVEVADMIVELLSHHS